LASSIVYGPVPSRRLGRSLGINNIPPKKCSYSCVYCQLGQTLRMELEPKHFYKTTRIAEQARTKLDQALRMGERVDYITFVPDGEPTLDANLSEEITAVKALGVRVAVITNGSLLWREDVRQSMLKSDWLSLKVDAVNEETWRKVNRPHRSLRLETILQGMVKFAKTFEGELTTETMLVRDVNDDPSEIKKIAEFLALLDPARAYVTIPTRPPAEWVEPASEQTINLAYHILAKRLRRVEYLIGYEGNAFACTGDVQEDLLSITAVHPMREDALAELLEKASTGWDTIQKLIDNGSLVVLEYQGKKFYLRKLAKRSLPRLSQTKSPK
jgi:wyosine [tRNA(Phe)-imidazoG37] synthetase (radical SAM superfamily)